MNNLQLPSSGWINGGGMNGRGFGLIPEAPAKGHGRSAAKFAPGARLVFQARFSQPLFNREGESKRRDPLREHAIVAVVTRDTISNKCIGVNAT